MSTDQSKPTAADAALQIAELQRQIRRMQEHDALTGLYKRETFLRKTQEFFERSPGGRYRIGAVDIDHFKLINDVYGSEAGDRILLAAAAGLSEWIGTRGTYGRLEADHFVFCVPAEMFDMDAFLAAAEKQMNSTGLNYHISIRCGICEVEDDDTPVERMCDRAKMAMENLAGGYQSRGQVYNHQMLESMLQEQSILAETEEAFRDHQFVVYYQPIFKASTEELESAEALVRWQHPWRGLMQPGSFIPIFEKNGYISRLDEYVWREVCRFQGERKKAGRRILPVSMNMSRNDIYQADLCDRIVKMVDEAGLDHEDIHFEITESAYIDSHTKLLEVVKNLRSKGFRFLMDDFGSGYSSLNILRELPFDYLKIDRDFIGDIETSQRGGSVLSSVIRLARRLGIPAIAEGVETRSQYIYLRGIGCGKIQGYYFSKPLPQEEYEKMLDQPGIYLPDESKRGRNMNRGLNFEEGLNPQQFPALNENAGDVPEDEQSSPLIMIVDDSPINRAILKRILKGYQILEAGDGRTAIDILQRNPDSISLVLLDIVMPIMNGYDFLEEVRSDEKFRTLPIIVMTEAETAENEIMALEYGANDYLKKPYDPMTIRLRAGNFLNQKRLTNDSRAMQNILGNLPGAIIVFRLIDGLHVVYATDSLVKMSGYPQQEYISLLNHKAPELMREEDYQRIVSTAETARTSGQDETIEYQIRTRDGVTGWHHAVIRFADTQKHGGLFYTMVTDCTEEKQKRTS